MSRNNPFLRRHFGRGLAVFFFFARVWTLAAPRIASDSLACDFGTLANTEAVNHTFTISNTGDEPLKIDRLRVCCGATATMVPMELAPGASGKLTVNLSLLGRDGPQRKSIYIVSNDPQTPYLALKLVGTALARVRLQPDRIDFGATKGNDEAERRLRLTAAPGVEFTIRSVSATPNCFAASLIEAADRPGYEVVVRTVPPLPNGFVSGKLLVATDLPTPSTIEVSIAAHVDSDVVVVPRELTVEAVDEQGNAGTKYLAIRLRSGAEFHILDVEAPPGVRVETSPLGRRGYRFAIHGLTVEQARQEPFLTIRTDADGLGEIDIPIRTPHTKGN